jgi:hypothetical protein
MHPSKARLQAYRDGELGERAARRISRHLDGCSRCKLRMELDAWQVSRLVSGVRQSEPDKVAAMHLEEFLSAVRTRLTGRLPLTPSMRALLIGRRAALRASNRLSSRPLVLTLVVVTALYLTLGLAAWGVWELTGNFGAVRQFFDSAGDLFLAALSAAAFYFSLQVWRELEPGEPLYRGWFLIAAAGAAGLAGSIFSKLIAHASPAWGSLDGNQVREFGLFLGGPLTMVLMAWGFGSILRAYHRAGILNRRWTALDWMLFAPIGAYTLAEGAQVVAAILDGRLRTMHDFIQAANDPLLLMLLAGAILLRNSVRKLGIPSVGRCWGAFQAAICLTSLGDMLLWGFNDLFLPMPLASIGWYVWFLSGACYALAPAFQLEAMAKTADCPATSQGAGSELAP